jgi:hypothetical protein
MELSGTFRRTLFGKTTKTSTENHENQPHVTTPTSETTQSNPTLADCRKTALA